MLACLAGRRPLFALLWPPPVIPALALGFCAVCALFWHAFFAGMALLRAGRIWGAALCRRLSCALQNSVGAFRHRW